MVLRRKKKDATGYALCVGNEGNEVSLELLKLYQIVEPEPNDPPDWLRVIDESGEDYVYPAASFVVLTLPGDVEERVAGAFNSAVA
jgi:primosomal protein N'